MVNRFGNIGQIIEISPDSSHHINPLDINLTDNGDENPLALKADFVLSLMELVVGGKDGLQPIERTVIDRCTRLVYRDVLNDPENAPMPILQDLYELLNAQPEPEAKRLAKQTPTRWCADTTTKSMCMFGGKLQTMKWLWTWLKKFSWQRCGLSACMIPNKLRFVLGCIVSLPTN